MRHAIISAVLALGLALPLTAQEGAGTAIEGVIQNQLNAFQNDDFDTAFTFASPGIKQIFRTPENFGAMVKRGYPMVYRPGEVQFLDLSGNDTVKRQKVMIRDQSGAFFMLEYEMTRTGDGWQISGVRFLEMPQVGA